MKLSKVEITNFRCFERLDIPLQPDVNIFVGVNGAGKTTILDAIAISLYDIVAANGGGGKRQRNIQRATLKTSDMHVPSQTSNTVAGQIDFVQVRAAVNDFYAVPGFPNKTAEEKPAVIEWTNLIRYSPPRDFTYDNSKSERLLVIYQYFESIWQEIRQSGDRALIPLPVVAYYRSNRNISQMPSLGDIFGLTLERQDAFNRALDAGADYQAMCQWFYLRENQELRERLQIRRDVTYEFPELKAARQAVAHIIENVERVFFDDSPPNLKVEFADSHGSLKIVELEQLSDGYRNLLALVLDFARRLAQAHPNWDSPLEAPGILLIDEIELHLHPGWQQTVIPHLREVFPNTQLIVATHSPQVLTTVKREHVRVLTEEHQIESLPREIGTYGAESAYALEMVFGVHTRPRSIQSVTKLESYLQMVEAREYESDAARTLRTELELDLGVYDPSLVRADARIRQLKVMAKR